MRHSRNSIVLVTGGTGLVGGAVIVELARRGERVRAVVRGASAEVARERLLARLRKTLSFRMSLEALIDVAVGDTCAPAFGLTAAEMAGVGCVVHCAANTEFSEREDERIWATNVGGAQQLVALTRAYAPEARVIFVGTAAVVTAPEGAIVDEYAPFAGYDNTYTRSKREAEAIVTAAGLDVIVVRPSIVLSRGVADRELARSVLWAIPIMSEIGDVPVEPDAHVDCVPVDYVAEAIARLVQRPAVSERLLHISAGDRSETFAELIAAIARHNPDYGTIRACGRAAARSRRRARLMRPIDSYLPFINMDVRYATARLHRELDWPDGPPSARTYLPDLMALIDLGEALEAMYRP